MPEPSRDFDDLVIGAGMAGLATGALLARQGRRVLMLEAHDTPGGYAHTFRMGEYRFCAQVHYIFNCGEGEPVHELLRRLDLHESVRFLRLDPEGYDHVVVAGERFRIPNGLEKFRDRLTRRFPEAARPLRRYFDAIMHIGRELDVLPRKPQWRDLITAPLRFPHLLRYRNWTLQRLYDQVRMPQRLQAVLAGQAGDYLLPPEAVSLLLHVALVRGYDRGAYYPEKHYQHLITSIADSIRNAPGCQLLLQTEVDRILVESGRVVGVRTRQGDVHRARRYISNLDPQRMATLIERRQLPSRYLDKLHYAYSDSTITVYLGVRGLDLRDHGFGSYNVWHYPHDDLNAIYRRQASGDLRDPWLFMSTPSLHTREPGICPPGTQILEIATSAPWQRFHALRESDRKQYEAQKKRARDDILRVVEERYVPNLGRHIVRRVTGTPATNARYCWAPEGNAYGAALTPENMHPTLRSFETPFRNLWQVNATAGYPSIAGTIGAAMTLVDQELS
ncbi:MAG: NAD(P)/FAD-dependent oxidoreductase [Polyangiaceae bacterium]